MSLDPATVRRIATLARIRVEEAELATLAAELNGILGWIEQLNEVNVDGVEPLTGAAQMALKMRDDVVTDGGYPDKVLANAPGPRRRLLRRAEGGRMTLTDLTIAAARDGLRAQRIHAPRTDPGASARDRGAEPAAERLHHGQPASARWRRPTPPTRRWRAGQSAPLTGIPLAIKDLFCTEGVRTTAGSKILGPFVPPYESTVTRQPAARRRGVPRQDQHGRVRHGLVQHDLGLRPGENPWKRRQDASAMLVPGGSSGGSAAAVSARLAMGATGTDTGGSIRQPASFCGIVGMKPTYGRCSRWGVVAFASSLDHPGPFARTVRDCAILLGSMAGHDPKDSTSADVPVPDFRGRLRARREGPAHRRAARIPLRRHAGRDRGAVAAGPGLAARRRRRDRRRVAAAHEVRPGHLLHRRPGRGVVEPGAL